MLVRKMSWNRKLFDVIDVVHKALALQVDLYCARLLSFLFNIIEFCTEVSLRVSWIIALIVYSGMVSFAQTSAVPFPDDLLATELIWAWTELSINENYVLMCNCAVETLAPVLVLCAYSASLRLTANLHTNVWVLSLCAFSHSRTSFCQRLITYVLNLRQAY